MGTCMAIVAGTSSDSQNMSAVAAAGAFIFLFSLFFPTGFLGLTFLYASEISPLSARVPITSLSTGSAWLFNFLVRGCRERYCSRKLTRSRLPKSRQWALPRSVGDTISFGPASTSSSSCPVSQILDHVELFGLTCCSRILLLSRNEWTAP